MKHHSIGSRSPLQMALIHPDASITFAVSENRPQHVHIRGPEVRMSGSSRVKISVTNPGEAAQWLLAASLVGTAAGHSGAAALRFRTVPCGTIVNYVISIDC